MINVSTLIRSSSGNFRCSSVICNVPVRSLLSLMYKRLIAASARISTLQTTPPPPSAVQSFARALDSSNSITERKRAEKSAPLFNMFRDYGFEDSQIQKLSEYPRLGQLSARILKPKLDCLVENGFTGELLHKLIVSAPYILYNSLDARIEPNLQLLKQYLDSDEKVVRVINRNKFILCIDLERHFIPNIELLINEGVPVDRVSKLLVMHPRVAQTSRDRIANAVRTVREFGVPPDNPMFIRCLRIVCVYSESSLKKKLELFKSFGCSDEQVSHVVKKCPGILGLSEENLRSKMRFYVNTLKLEPETVFVHPTLFSYSDERIHARHEVLKILKLQKLSRGVSVASVARMSEDQFLNSYVIKHENSVLGLLDMYYALLKKKGHQTLTAKEKVKSRISSELWRYFSS